MQAPTTAPVATAPTSSLHTRVGRNSAAALQPGAASESFDTTLAQALVAPGPTAPVRPGPGGSNVTLLVAASPTPAQSVPLTGVGKAVITAPGSPIAKPDQDKKPSVPGASTEAAQPLVQPPLTQPPLTQPAPVPVSDAASVAPALPAGPDFIAPDTSEEASKLPAVDVAPLQPTASEATPMTPASALHPAALPGVGGTVVHPSPDQLLAFPGHEAVASKSDDAVDALSAVGSAQLVAAPAATVAGLHVASASPSVLRPPPAPGLSTPSPAGQVGPVLASFAASAAQPGAAQHLTIQLDPAELGHVQVRIERIPDGPARVELIVERPETLRLLLHDQPQLHRALDLAGVPVAERTLQIHLAPAAAHPGMATSQPNADASPGQQRHSHPRSRGASSGSLALLDESSLRPADAFRRAGVDITA